MNGKHIKFSMGLSSTPLKYNKTCEVRKINNVQSIQCRFGTFINVAADGFSDA